MEAKFASSFYSESLENFLALKGITLEQRFPLFYSNNLELKKMALMEMNAAKQYLSTRRTEEKMESEFVNAIAMNRLEYCSAYIDDLVMNRAGESSAIRRCIVYYQNYLSELYTK